VSTLIAPGQTGALDNINISQGQFRDQLAVLIAEVRALRTELNQLKLQVANL
jgi:hypothetical protein